MQFEFDEAKSRRNKRKHGIDFVKAQALWQDSARVESPSPRKGDARFRVIGTIRGKHWSAFVVYRGAKIRIISVRRSRKVEVAKYEGHQH